MSDYNVVKFDALLLLVNCYLYSLSKESIIDVEGMLSTAPEKVLGCSQQDVEIIVTKVATCLHTLLCQSLVLILVAFHWTLIAIRYVHTAGS